MKPSKLYEALRALIGEHVPLHIWGPCGTGKSQIVCQVTNDLDYEFLDVRAVQLDPVDLRGLPRISSDQNEWVPPKFLPNSGKGILFLDELTSAPQMTQAGCYELVLDRRLGEYRLPDEWVVIAAGNPASERGAHFAMPRPLRNRFVHLDLEPDLDDWSKWAVKAHVRPEIIAFLHFKPELLHAADVISDANAWQTPRSWEMASRVLAGVARRTNARLLSGTSEFEAQLLDGTVEHPAASELVAFLRLFRELPSIDEILLNPTTANVPQEPSAQIAIATALGRALSDTSVGRGITYLERMPTEMRVMAMRDAAARDTAITHTPEFVRFGVVDLLRTHATEATLEENAFRELESCIHQQRIDGVITCDVPSLGIATRASQVMLQSRMHHLMRQRSGQRGCGECFDEFRIPEKRNPIGGHRFRFNSFGAMLVEGSAAVSEQFDRSQHVMKDRRLEYVQLKVALRTSEDDGSASSTYTTNLSMWRRRGGQAQVKSCAAASGTFCPQAPTMRLND